MDCDPYKDTLIEGKQQNPLKIQNSLLEQNEFSIILKSFDDNKVLKNCQLNMLIFVQVYKTMDKIFEIINRFWKNKREQRNKQKGSLKVSEENCS